MHGANVEVRVIKYFCFPLSVLFHRYCIHQVPYKILAITYLINITGTVYYLTTVTSHIVSALFKYIE